MVYPIRKDGLTIRKVWLIAEKAYWGQWTEGRAKEGGEKVQLRLE
jgi:hypothetical protein